MAISGADAFDILTHVYRGRWFMMYASLWIMSAAGATYVFAVYSKDIKYTLGYNQEQLNKMGFFKDLGANFGIISGLINEVMPGPWVVLLFGSLMNFVGYFMIYLSITGRIARPSLFLMCLYIAVGANSQGFANTAALVPCVVNFPESRGIVLGLLKGFVGLSGAIFSQLYHAVYGEDSKSLVLLIAWLPSVISILLVHSIRFIKPIRQPKEFNVFCQFLYVSVAIAVYLLVVIVIEKLSSFSRRGYIVSAVIILLLLLAPLITVSIEGHRLWKQKKLETLNPPPITIVTKTDEDEKSDIKDKSPKKSGEGCCSNIFSPPKRGQDYSILQALLSIDMVIIFVATAIGTGGALTATDNMGQIGESLGYKNKSIGAFVTLINIWGYFGRVGAGFFSETLIKKYKCPRPLMQAVILFISCIGFALIALPCKGSVYIATVIIGLTFGAQQPLFLSMISELFGLKHYSTLFNVGVLSSPVGSYVFNVETTGKIYDRVARKQLGGVVVEGKALTCMGKECYRLSFLIVTAATFCAGLMMLVLAWRTRHFYGSDIYAKFKEEAEVSKKKMEISEKAVVAKEVEESKEEKS